MVGGDHGVNWLGQVLADNIQILGGLMQGFVEWGATLAAMHDQQTQKQGNTGWSCHAESRHGPLSGGLHTNTAALCKPTPQYSCLSTPYLLAGRPMQNSITYTFCNRFGRHAGYMYFQFPAKLSFTSPLYEFHGFSALARGIYAGHKECCSHAQRCIHC